MTETTVKTQFDQVQDFDFKTLRHIVRIIIVTPRTPILEMESQKNTRMLAEQPSPTGRNTLIVRTHSDSGF